MDGGCKQHGSGKGGQGKLLHGEIPGVNFEVD
jgi:hypothetical protein